MLHKVLYVIDRCIKFIKIFVCFFLRIGLIIVQLMRGKTNFFTIHDTSNSGFSLWIYLRYTSTFRKIFGIYIFKIYYKLFNIIFLTRKYNIAWIGSDIIQICLFRDVSVTLWSCKANVGRRQASRHVCASLDVFAG